jgi:DNA-binding MarR family transcriptional regulator
MSSNSKGAFERARQQWKFGAVYICRRMGRAATGALTAVAHLEEFTSRALFYRDGHLVAFPALDLLALRAGVNEKTMRRNINKLEEAGLVRIQRRHNDSNFYFLTTPPDAEAHLIETEAAIIKRAKARKRHSQVSPRARQMGAETPKNPPKCPTTSDSTSEFTSIPKGCDEGSQPRKYKEEKRVAEEERQTKEETENPNRPPDSFFTSLGSAFQGVPPRSDAFSRARQFGERGATVISVAESRGVPPDEINCAIDSVINDGGDVNDLAHMLLHGGEYY